MLEIKPLGDVAGAVVYGLDPREPISADDFGRIYAAFLDRLVLVFPEAPLTAQQLCDLGRHFGELQPHIAKRYRHPEVPEVVLMTNRDAAGNMDEAGAARGVGWHSDLAYETVPAKATLLHALEVPNRGGNTMFANMYRAYEAMPRKLRERIDGRNAIFCYGGRAKMNLAALNEEDQATPLVVHPAVREHPETKRRSVYVNPYHAVAISGMSIRESNELLDEVFDFCSREEFQWEHTWKVGDTIMWENRSAWHSGKLDYPRDQARIFIRTTVRGTPTVDDEAVRTAFEDFARRRASVQASA
jgi:taurine dioxygenase